MIGRRGASTLHAVPHEQASPNVRQGVLRHIWGLAPSISTVTWYLRTTTFLRKLPHVGWSTLLSVRRTRISVVPLRSIVIDCSLRAACPKLLGASSGTLRCSSGGSSYVRRYSTKALHYVRTDWLASTGGRRTTRLRDRFSAGLLAQDLPCTTSAINVI